MAHLNEDNGIPDPFDAECWTEAEKIVAYLRDGVGPSDVITVATLLAIFRDKGAAALGGLIAMADAIKRNGPPLVKRDYWASEIDGGVYYDCNCPGCGCQMKRRTAGRDEGTDNEWCGACRY